MTEQEEFILDAVLRGEPFICCHDGYAYFLGPEAPDRLNWQYAIDWCKSLGDEYELPNKEVLNECFKNDSIRKEFKRGGWYWSSTVHEKYGSRIWGQSFDSGYQNDYHHEGIYFVWAVCNIKIC